MEAVILNSDMFVIFFFLRGFTIRGAPAVVQLWHNGIGSILEALGRRFDPWPGTVG